MSATLPGGPLTTADTPAAGETVEIRPGERIGELAVRLGAERTVRRLEAEPGDYRKIAAAVRELHCPGTLTLVVLNTVPAAREVYKRLRGAAAGRTLLHARFRGIERAPLMARVAACPHDRIVVATQVIEAGIDLNATVLVTEAAPWPALVQRAGQCNRTGLMNSGAGVWWIPPPTPAPYEQADIDATSAELDLLEGERVTGEALLERAVFTMPQQAAVVRRSDFIGFFDTSTDLSGADVDIARYVRDADDLDAEIAWASWTLGAGGAPDPEVKAPPAEYRCRVPLRNVARLATKDRAVWRRDQVTGKWVTITAPGQSRARPGEVLLVNAADGGYDPKTGFDLSARGPVCGSPELHTVAELAEIMAGTEDAWRADSASVDHERGWRSLDQHSAEVRAQADALLRVLAPGLPAGAAESAIVAGYLHDAGKAHETWQDALCALAPAEERGQVASGRPWAKSGARGGRLMFKDDVAFRHELASLLLIDGPLNDLLAKAPDRDLARYLVLAHHGRLRVQVRDPGDLAVPPEREAAAKILGLEQGTTTNVPAMLGQPATTLTVDLSQFEPGAAWTRAALGLRDKYGPFVLAYLETLVRVADWRASGGKDLPA
jgi:CRISPR-associated endonuclease/helicase Cas3